MPLFTPSAVLDRVTEIAPPLLQELGAEILLLDVDNTLAADGSQEPFPGAVEWTWKIREAGFQIMILSNNFRDRVEPFAEKFNLPCLCLAMKPLPFGYWAALHRLKTKRKKAVVVGDQIFTDVLGAGLAGMKSILLTPEKEEDSFSFRVRRALERPIRKRLKQRADGKKSSGGG